MVHFQIDITNMICEFCGKQIVQENKANVLAKVADDPNYLLIGDCCINDLEKWIPKDWEKVVDNTGTVLWTCTQSNI